MKIVERTFTEPALNLACDEALLERVEADGDAWECLRIWEAETHFVVLGHSNRIRTHTNVKACKKEQIPILRRVSGGGTVVQGPGCLNYALTLKNESHRNIRDVYGLVLERHCQALNAICRVAPRFQGISDLTIGDLKFSGNSQYRKARSVLVHGTFLLNFDLTVIDRVLPVPPEQPAYREDRPHDQFLVNLQLNRAAVAHALQRAWSADEELASLPSERIEQLANERYRRREWSELF